MKLPSADEAIQEIQKWAEAPKAKKHIDKMHDKIQKASQKVFEDATLSPEKLKFRINI